MVVLLKNVPTVGSHLGGSPFLGFLEAAGNGCIAKKRGQLFWGRTWGAPPSPFGGAGEGPEMAVLLRTLLLWADDSGVAHVLRPTVARGRGIGATGEGGLGLPRGASCKLCLAKPRPLDSSCCPGGRGAFARRTRCCCVSQALSRPHPPYALCPKHWVGVRTKVAGRGA